ncbi:MAG: Fluoroacetate dehalogenase [Alphaproteobacteria bacterium MarineAlpha9_Bin4]|nr:MAG: Fluoroacetate dehalogenase [Alphaproteobacteria bacterium MarineAlpha9_Bin4]|tara:strand:+ start:1358 stop:2227 length:870 start_codon:yes stop_codon:yes gene_type:complete
MFKNFKLNKIKVNGIKINYRIGGKGPAILLLHGYPQTHIMWRKIANQLTNHFTVICSDLRGYGDSDKPKSDDTHSTYSKEKMASDQHKLMLKLGFKKYFLVGHDRGGRVAHRMSINFKNIIKVIFLDIIPTNTVFELANQELARKYYHWFFLIQKYPLPEKLIEANSEFYLKTKLKMWGNTKSFIEPKAMKEYLRCFAKKTTIHASCEDYRAAASIDIMHHKQDKEKKITCPVLILWGKKGTIEKLYNPIRIWKKWASDVTGYSINCGHFLPEEKPKEVMVAIQKFFMN